MCLSVSNYCCPTLNRGHDTKPLLANLYNKTFSLTERILHSERVHRTMHLRSYFEHKILCCTFLSYKYKSRVARDNVARIATTLRVGMSRGSNPGGGEIFLPLQSGPEAHPASCKMGVSWCIFSKFSRVSRG